MILFIVAIGIGALRLRSILTTRHQVKKETPIDPMEILSITPPTEAQINAIQIRGK